ncbi:STM4015 family protein [Streptomyces sp. NPDC087440]|uniref:STM4015 family protein n=1 Tax=Streptomyces sp. NPDC087440 TaxID=3365790 RepID=UPI0037F5F19C
MYSIDHLSEFHGLPVVTFPEPGDDAALPDADTVAWRVHVESWDGEEDWMESFDRFLAAVDPGRVRALVIGRWGEFGPESSSTVLSLITAAADRLTTLEAVFIGDMTPEDEEMCGIEQSDVTVLLSAFPDLVELGVRGGTELEFPPVTHEKLRRLTMETGGLPRAVANGIAASTLPALTHLDLWLGESGCGGDAELSDLAPLLDGTRFPGLTYLGLRNSEIQNEIAEAVAGAPVVAGLHTLDLSNGVLGDEGAAALLEGQPLTHLRCLDLHHHFLSAEMERRIQAEIAAHGVRVDLSQRNTPWGGRGSAGRFTSVSE